MDFAVARGILNGLAWGCTVEDIWQLQRLVTAQGSVYGAVVAELAAKYAKSGWL